MPPEPARTPAADCDDIHIPSRGVGHRCGDGTPIAEAEPAKLDQPQYEISVWRDDHRSPALRSAWESFARSRESPAAIYQSPEYFDYLQEGDEQGHFDILTVKDKGTDAVVGIVPIKRWAYRLPFMFRARAFMEIRRRTIGILGSEPMIPENPRAFDELFLTFARRYPESQAIYMDAVPATSYLWHHLQTSRTIRGLYHTLVMDGFREWHSVPLPKSVNEYYKKIPRKKRYNLMRQERLLQSHCGHHLHLATIDKESDLQCLFEAMEKLLAKDTYNMVFRKDDYVHLSRHGLLHCYVLKSGEDIVGLLLGMKAGKTFKIDRLAHDPSLERFSPGTTLWQLVLKDLINKREFTSVDFGYGVPVYRHSSTNIIERKGRILLFRRSVANRCLILAYLCYSTAVRFVKNRMGRDSRPSE
jgi:CelD/BcsL family acetyltransferase involved in cellulose biosynthesis